MKIIIKFLRSIKYLAFISSCKFFFLKKIKNYDNITLNKSIIKKTNKFGKFNSINEYDVNIERTIKFLKFVKKKKIKNITDFGGGAGYHYLIAKIKFPSIITKWSIVENKTMVRLCDKVNKYKNLFFFNSLNNIKKTEILFSSCAINYMKYPLKTLEVISKLNAKYLYFTRTPLAENKSIKFKQISLLSDNGPCKIKNEKKILVEYENNIISIKYFENIFKNKFIVVSKYVDQKSAFSFNNSFFDTYTYIFKKKI